MWLHTSGGGVLRQVTICDNDSGGVRKSWNSCDVIYQWSLTKKVLLVPCRCILGSSVQMKVKRALSAYTFALHCMHLKIIF